MSEDGRDNDYVPEDDGKDPDYVPECSTIETKDLHSSGDEELEPQSRPRPKSDFHQFRRLARSGNVDGNQSKKVKKDRRTSMIWTKFTIIDKKNKIASCNICDIKMSIRSTSHNLKKHLERKHGLNIPKCFERSDQPKYITPTPRPKLSELAGISEEGITLKVVGENGEEEHFQVIGEQFLSEEVVQGQAEDHDYSLDPQTGEMIPKRDIKSDPLRIGQVRSLSQQQSSHTIPDPPPLYRPSRTFTSFGDEKSKRQRIMDLQIECLENKRYNMQLESLLMEQQLNLPRSIFTDTLRCADTRTRSTQTEVGGRDTRVFYVSDKRGGRPIQQLFAYEEDLDL